jgi:hypothetical protein
MTYNHLIKSMKDCMEALKAQIKIMESAEKRLMEPLAEHMGIKGKAH